LVNFTGEFENVSTLAHEMGHAMHSYFSSRHQPYPTAGYSIFVAEVASTLNEALLAHEALERAQDDDERMFLICRQLEGLRGTLFRQALFAEFELALHRRTERGEPVTADELCTDYLALVRRYHGHDEGVVHVDERFGVEWAAVPHFYYEFYVYQYATGIVAAMALCEKILAAGPAVAREYLDFLRAGGSAYPLELLQRAGVDLLERAPYDAAFAAMDRLLDDLEELIANRQRA
jgi:oligoendopeptidase F